MSIMYEGTWTTRELCWPCPLVRFPDNTVDCSVLCCPLKGLPWGTGSPYTLWCWQWSVLHTVLTCLRSLSSHFLQLFLTCPCSLSPSALQTFLTCLGCLWSARKTPLTDPSSLWSTRKALLTYLSSLWPTWLIRAHYDLPERHSWLVRAHHDLLKDTPDLSEFIMISWKTLLTYPSSLWSPERHYWLIRAHYDLPERHSWLIRAHYDLLKDNPDLSWPVRAHYGPPERHSWRIRAHYDLHERHSWPIRAHYDLRKKIRCTGRSFSKTSNNDTVCRPIVSSGGNKVGICWLSTLWKQLAEVMTSRLHFYRYGRCSDAR